MFETYVIVVVFLGVDQVSIVDLFFEISDSLVHDDKYWRYSGEDCVKQTAEERQEQELNREAVQHLKVQLTECQQSILVDVELHECGHLIIHFKTVQKQ